METCLGEDEMEGLILEFMIFRKKTLTVIEENDIDIGSNVFLH